MLTMCPARECAAEATVGLDSWFAVLGSGLGNQGLWVAEVSTEALQRKTHVNRVKGLSERRLLSGVEQSEMAECDYVMSCVKTEAIDNKLLTCDESSALNLEEVRCLDALIGAGEGAVLEIFCGMV